MAKIHLDVLTDKGVLKYKVKNHVKEYEMERLVPTLAELEYQQLDDESTFVKDYVDANGTVFYAVLEFKTTLLHPADRSKPTKKDTDEPEIIITQE